MLSIYILYFIIYDLKKYLENHPLKKNYNLCWTKIIVHLLQQKSFSSSLSFFHAIAGLLSIKLYYYF